MAQDPFLQDVYDSLADDKVFLNDPLAADIGHTLRAEGVVVDATQGGLFPQKAPKPAATPKRSTYPPSPYAGSVHAPLARRIAGEVGVPVDLFMGLIEQESAWNPKAVSKAGARGLGQLMPGTAAGLGVKDSFDPEQNLRGAARYLRAQLDRFKGNEEHALAAYNAGPGAVQKYGGIPPFAETQDYVRRVRERRLRYADPPGAPLKPTPTAQKPAGRATVTKAQPVAIPVAGGLLPEEKAFQAADAAWQKRPAFAKLPGYRQAEQGPVAQLWEDRNVALAGISRVLPQLGKKFDSEEKALKPLVGTLKQLEKKVTAGAATPDEERRFRLLAKRFVAQDERAGRINQYATTLQKTPGFAGPIGVDKPIFDTLFYRDEEKAKPGLGREFAGQLYDSARNVARLVHPKGPEFAEEWLLPGEVYRGMAEQVDRERAQLQRAGVLRPLPAPSKDPAQRQRQIAEKNELLDLMRQAAAVSAPDETGRLYQKFDFNRDPAAFRAGVEQIRGSKLSPWQLRLLGPLHRNLKVEQQFNEKLLVAGSVDAVSEIAGDILAGFGGKAVGKLAGKALAKRLVRPTEGLLSREGLKYIATKGGVRVTSEAAGGALAGGVTSGAIEGGYAYSRGERGTDLLKTTAKAAGAGAATGALIGGGLSAAGIGREGATRAGRRWDPAIRQWVESHVPRIGSLAKGAKGEASVSPGPQVRAADGNLVNLREADGDTLAAIVQQAQSAGDTVTAERVQEWATRREAWDDARVYQVPKESIPDYLAAWNKASDPARRHYDVLTKAAADETIAPEVRAVLADAASEVNATFIDGFRARLGDPFPPVGPPQVSAWRRLTPEQRRSLPADVQKALIAQDAVNSQRVLDPEQVGPVKLKGTSPAHWERQADALYAKAQDALTREFGELPEGPPAVGEVLPPEGAPTARLEQPALGAGIPPQGLPQPFDVQPRGEPAALPEARLGVPWEPQPTPTAVPEPNVQGATAEPGALPSAYQAAEMRARAAAQPVGALDTSPTLRSQADIVASRFGVEPVATQTDTGTLSPVTGAETTTPTPIRSAADIAAERAGIPTSRGDTAATPAPDVAIPRQTDATAEASQQAPAYTGPERRVDTERRKKVSEMTPEERAAALLTDEKTGLGNERAYLESEKAAHQVAIDADSLKWWNDTFGHPAGDQLLGAIGRALKEAGVDGYHISGDEFVVQGNDPAALKKAMAFADDYLASAAITVTKGKKTKTLKGLSISYAIKPTNEQVGSPGEAGYRPAYNDADKALKRAKAARERAGLRAPRGERPPGYAEVGKAEGVTRRGEGQDKPAVARRGGAAQGEARTVAPRASGTETTFKAGNQTFEGRWTVRDIADVVTSHDDALNANPNYPTELQPRDRGRMASREQVADLAQKLDPQLMGENPLAQHGAPIVGPDGVVESGNGRTIALRQLYARKGAGAYRRWLAENAAKFGIDPEVLKAIKNPILVRTRLTDLSPEGRVRFTRDANARETAAMGATEQAATDAERLAPDMVRTLDLGEAGDLGSASNRTFVRAFIGAVPTSEQGVFRTADGALSQEGMRRIKNALFLKAYGDVDALSRMAESLDDPARNITNGMLRGAGPLIDLSSRIEEGSAYPVNIGPDVAAAASKLAGLRERGTSIGEYLAQQGMFEADLSPLQKSILVNLEEMKRAPRRIAAVLADYADLAIKAGDPSTGKLFDDIAPPEKETLWQAAVDRSQRMATDEPTLFAEPQKPEAIAAEGRGAAPAVRQAAQGAAGSAPAKTAGQPAKKVAPKKAAPRPDATVPPSTRAAVKADADAAKARLQERGRKGGEVGGMRYERPDWADELESVGGKIDDDGTVLLYHATTKAAAERIVKEGVLRLPPGAPDAYGVYLGSSESVSESYGDGTVVPVRVRAADLSLDDIFPGERADFMTPTKSGVYRPVAVGEAALRKSPSAIPVRADGDAGPRRAMSDTPGAVQGKPSKSRRGDCG